MKPTRGAVFLATILALAGTETSSARAQALLVNPDVDGKLDMLAHTCLPKTYTAGKTIGGVFIPAVPGTAVRFDCHVPSFEEQSFTVAVTGLYDIVVAGAEGGRGAFVRMPNVGDNGPEQNNGISIPARASGGAGGVVRGQMLLNAGTVLYIDVGQRGGDGGAVSGGGGGGATFLLDASKKPIAVGAGGGGASWTEDAGAAPSETLNSTQAIAPDQGGGATQDSGLDDSGGGGGFYQNGANGYGRIFGLDHSNGGFDYAEGLFGGYGGSGLTQNDFAGSGGFGGGGGGGDGTRAGGGGGGGGYKGGYGGKGRDGLIGTVIAYANGGGGGSNYSGSLLGVSTAGNADDGYVTLVLVR